VQAGRLPSGAGRAVVVQARAYLAEEGRILVEFEPVGDKQQRDLAYRMSREVTAGRWQGRYARAHYPLSADKCVEMRRTWGAALMVHKDLADWYRTAYVQRADQVALTKATDADLELLPQLAPEFTTWLKSDQRVAAAWIRDAYRDGGLLADEVGTGKTFSVTAGLMERGVKGSILIVCPKLSVRRVWGAALRRWAPWPVYLAYGTRARRQRAIDAFLADADADTAVLVVVSEMLRIQAKRVRGRVKDMAGYEYPDLFDVDWDAVVLDEAHKLLGGMDITHGNLAAEGLRRMNYATPALRLAATATPWGKGGKAESLFGHLHWLWPDEFPGKWAWLGKYFDVRQEQVFIKGGGGRKREVWKVGDLKNGVDEQRLFEDLGPRVLRRTMEEVSPEHAGLRNPPIVVECDMGPAQVRQYKEFVTHGEVPIKGGILSSLGTLSFYTRARQCANGVLRMEGEKVRYDGESGKVDRLMQHLEEHGILDGSSRRKVVVASQFNEFLDVVAQELQSCGTEYVQMTGTTNEAERDRIMDAFQGEGGPQVFLLNAKAGGVSITLDAADEMHELDEMYPPEANTQLFGRIFRRGRAHEVWYYIYRSVGTIDEKIGVGVASGAATQARLLDGRRGLTQVRELAQYREPED
jgi:SNF2 family DNA or RNA helicase